MANIQAQYKSSQKYLFRVKIKSMVVVEFASNNSSSDIPPSYQSEGSVETIQQVETPKMYKVILLNDDYTPMDFVTLVLKRFFGKTEEQANKIMLDVHQKGSGTAGVFTLEIAEMKVVQVNQFSRQNQHPLKTTLEPE